MCWAIWPAGSRTRPMLVAGAYRSDELYPSAAHA